MELDNNIISVYQSEKTLMSIKNSNLKRNLKDCEVSVMESLCQNLKLAGAPKSAFNHYTVSYTINQIPNEFDLLRFGENYIINIELKSNLRESKYKEISKKPDKQNLSEEEKAKIVDDYIMQKIRKQMEKNELYLKALGKPYRIYEFVNEVGLYEYIADTKQIIEIDFSLLVDTIKNQNVLKNINPDVIFKPSNYLISPFNKTGQFINGEYFLTDQQSNVKKSIVDGLKNGSYMFYTLLADAGTGKTLLLYDIAKYYINVGLKIKIYHGGKLNSGHNTLNEKYKWEISSVKEITSNINLHGYQIIFCDETQRFSVNQFKYLIDNAIKNHIPVILSYDVKQYLKEGETLDVAKYLTDNYPNCIINEHALSGKIRTNKTMASFIKNFIDIGSSSVDLDYSNISIKYFDNVKDAKEYSDYIKQCDWNIITFSDSLKASEPDPYRKLKIFSNYTAHDVLGQEFSKVAFIMDDNFKYVNNHLNAKKSYYSANGMVYQIITRAVDELQIIVLENPELYEKLLEIKALYFK